MKLIYTLIFLFGLSTTIFSQTESHTQKTKDIKDNPQYLKFLEMQKSKGIANIQVSEYFGLESKITPLLINEVIPTALPKSLGYSDKSKYIETLNLWLKENQNFVKADKKNTLIVE